MNQSQSNLLATISAVQCIRGFLEICPLLRNAVHTAFKVDYLKGERDSALYWTKQATVLGRMQLQAQSALGFVPTPNLRFGTGSQSFAHLAAGSVYRTAFEIAEECITDLVTHHGDFVKALEVEKVFFMATEVRETLPNELPHTEAVLNGLNDLKALADAVLRHASITA